jgi:hypothetical protein
MDFRHESPAEYVWEDPLTVLQVPFVKVEKRFKNDQNWSLEDDRNELKFSRSGQKDQSISIDSDNDKITYNLGSEIEGLEEECYYLLESHSESDLIEDELKAYIMPGRREEEYLREQRPKYVRNSGIDVHEPISLDEIVDVLVP